MDNEAPNYANWIPQAGGYVANGKVVSKSPQYDANGKLKLDVDASLFQIQPSQASNNVQVANNPITNNGITTANTTGSGTDVNSIATNIGSMGSLNLNTANPDESAISTPATKSPVAGETILTPVDEVLKEIQDAAGRNDLQGEINGYVKLSRLNPTEDYSGIIETLTQQREQKIMDIDDQYVAQYNQAKTYYDQALRNYNQAMASGDENTKNEALSQLLQAQDLINQVSLQRENWQNQVGYQNAMQSAKQRALDQLDLDWKTQYLEGARQIAGMLPQLLGNYLNFQYDPYQDTALQIAQQYATSRVKEVANSTGMYYSSQTQNAVARAVAELVPVYEKMAKEEMREQLSLIQSTANFLMNLEQAEFNMWRSQIQLQFEANAEKRAEFKQAVESSNARGYVTNAEAVILDVEAGSLSQKAREHEQELQEQLDAEQRALQQKITLGQYEVDWQEDLYRRKLEIDKQFKINDFAKDKTEPTVKITRELEDGTKLEYTVPYSEANTLLDEPIKEEKDTIVALTNTETGEKIPVNISKIARDIETLKDEEGNFSENRARIYVTETLKNYNQYEQLKALEQLKTEYFLPTIDALSEEYSSNRSSNVNKRREVYDKVEMFSNWISQTDIDSKNEENLISGLVVRMFNGIENAEEFDDTFFDIGTKKFQLERSKDRSMKQIVEAMEKSDNEILKDIISKRYSGLKEKIWL